MRLSAVIAVILLAQGGAVLTAQSATEHVSVVLPSAIDRVLRDYESAWRERDAEALAALFTDDGFVLSSGRAPVRGRAAIREQYAGSGGNLTLRAIGYAASDSVAYVVGMFSGNVGADVGKFVLALRRTAPDGPWLIAADMDNPNQRMEW